MATNKKLTSLEELKTSMTPEQHKQFSEIVDSDKMLKDLSGSVALSKLRLKMRPRVRESGLIKRVTEILNESRSGEEELSLDVQDMMESSSLEKLRNHLLFQFLMKI